MEIQNFGLVLADRHSNMYLLSLASACAGVRPYVVEVSWVRGTGHVVTSSACVKIKINEAAAPPIYLDITAQFVGVVTATVSFACLIHAKSCGKWR